MNKQRYLIIFDVNGTLLERFRKSNREKLRRVKEYGVDGFDMTIRHNHVLFRPGLCKFMKDMAAEFHCGIWTSAERQNIEPALERIFLHGSDNDTQSDSQVRIRLNKWLPYMLYKSQCDVIGRKDHKDICVKNLSKIWSGQVARELHITDSISWNSKNTILVDDSKHKGMNQPRNSLIIPTFSVESAGDKWRDDDILQKLLSYFQNMALTQPDDVRNYMEEHPFKPFV